MNRSLMASIALFGFAVVLGACVPTTPVSPTPDNPESPTPTTSANLRPYSSSHFSMRQIAARHKLL